MKPKGHHFNICSQAAVSILTPEIKCGKYEKIGHNMK